jgi:hypothetical protein
MNAIPKWTAATLGAIVGVIPALAYAQAYPSRPIRIVVGFRSM